MKEKWDERVRSYLQQYDAPYSPLDNLTIGHIATFAAWEDEQASQPSVQRTALQVRIFNVICYGVTAGSLLWLLFGNR